MMNKLREKLKGAKPLSLLLMVLGLMGLGLMLWPESTENGTMTAEEMRLSRTLSQMAGVGECSVSIWFDDRDTGFSNTASAPKGVLIVAQGAENLAVKIQLMDAAGRLLGLEKEHIAVFAMEETE